MTEDQMREIARGNIERNLCADWDPEDGDPSADYVYDDACTLGSDALVDAGVDHRTANRIAAEVAQLFAQP